MTLRFDPDGAERFANLLTSSERTVAAELAFAADPARAGKRLVGDTRVQHLTAPDSAMQRIACTIIGDGAFPVRALLFDKTPANNWPLGWHQDRTIAIKARADLPGFGPFTVKDGILHVQPPADILAGMATLRLHLDDTDDDNAPLKVAPGSHRLGMIPVAEVDSVVARMGQISCLAGRGDIWAYRTLILHASDPARRPRRRRVLQVDFASCDLPAPLDWLGV
jgi:hypothetical protein